MAKDAMPQFAVAAIKPTDPADDSQGFQTRGRHLCIGNEPLMDIISLAYTGTPSLLVERWRGWCMITTTLTEFRTASRTRLGTECNERVIKFTTTARRISDGHASHRGEACSGLYESTGAVRFHTHKDSGVEDLGASECGAGHLYGISGGAW